MSFADIAGGIAPFVPFIVVSASAVAAAKWWTQSRMGWTERVIVDEVPMDFLYSDGDDYYFMNTENYEQTMLKHSTLGDAVEYLIPNLSST